MEFLVLLAVTILIIIGVLVIIGICIYKTHEHRKKLKDENWNDASD